MEPLVHPGHVHRTGGSITPLGIRLYHHDHAKGDRPHGHNGALYVRDVRTCPKCFGPMGMTRSGTDERGRFEVWRCVIPLAGLPGVTPKGAVCTCSLRFENARPDQYGEVGGLKLEPNEIALRDADYDKAALARVKAKVPA